jgi:UDP-glucose 4-epimerase
VTLALVTGGAGFIGSHLTRALLERGWRVRVLDDFSTGSEKNLPAVNERLEVRRGDIRDPGAVRESVRGVDVVFHQAAFVSVPRSVAAPEACFSVNVQGTQTLLDAARAAGIHRVILASSAAVYGDNPAIPLTEEMAPRCLSPYAASKQMDEVLADLYTRAMGLEVTALRYFNVFGPHQSPDSDYAAAVPIFIRRMLERRPVTIYGDGGQTRDLIYVAEVAQANILAAEHSAAAGQVLNICSGHETRLLDLHAELKGLFPSAPEPEFAAARPGDIYRSAGSPLRAKSVLGFRSTTSLLEGLEKTVDWMKHELGLGMASDPA